MFIQLPGFDTDAEAFKIIHALYDGAVIKPNPSRSVVKMMSSKCTRSVSDLAIRNHIKLMKDERFETQQDLIGMHRPLIRLCMEYGAILDLASSHIAMFTSFRAMATRPRSSILSKSFTPMPS